MMAKEKTMTYNFDPERWYENEVRVLDRRLKAGEMDAAVHAAALDSLDRRYDEMVSRLDGTYQVC
jgi:hypothetical protein